jgi:hypothetical protein
MPRKSEPFGRCPVQAAGRTVNEMPQPDLTVLAEGDLPTGQHWILKAGGTTEDFYTFLETIHVDGHRDSGGMGGPPLYPGSLMNIYTGGADGGLRRVVVRADPSVAQVRLTLTRGEQVVLAPLGTRPDVSVTFFATLLPQTAGLASITATDADGCVLEPQDLSGHEAGWQRFLRRQSRRQD